MVASSIGLVTNMTCADLLKQLNDEYLAVHIPKEEAYWSRYMALKDDQPGRLEEQEKAFKDFVSDPKRLPEIRRALKDEWLSPEIKLGLEGWEALFSANQIESAQAKEIRGKAIKLENEIKHRLKETQLKLGYTDPNTGEWVKADLVKLSTTVSNDPDEKVRKAALGALYQHEQDVLDQGFIELIRLRNQFARSLGYSDFYAWKVETVDRMTKEELFSVLSDLEEKTRDTNERAIEKLVEEKGDKARDAWSFNFLSAGEVILQIAPFFPMERAVAIWAESFTALGVDFRQATVHADLVDRDKKYQNGFMHAPFPPYRDKNGVFYPARINLTSIAVPSAPTSGLNALRTLMHECGHTAHFSNVDMPSPAFSQEFSPTQASFAETQSRFFDSLMEDADWLVRYGKTEQGEKVPPDLVKKYLMAKRRFLARDLRWLISVPFAEKRFYELPDEELTRENIIKIARDVEEQMLGTRGSARPILTVAHLLNEEFSASYHGYVLARMGGYQTREYFFKKYGYILDNPKIGPELARVYWKEGNKKSFSDFLFSLTGSHFSADATIRAVAMSPEQAEKEIDLAIEKEKTIPRLSGPAKLNINFSVVHGDETIASTDGGLTLEQVSEEFANWIRSLK
ncbi:MAG: M3 family metallopeptidase [Bacteriovoracia bacterium]